MLHVMIISLIALTLLFLVICGAHGMTKKAYPNNSSWLYAVLYISIITAAAGIITLYLR